MAIAELLPLGARRRVVYLNDTPSKDETDAFRDHQYSVEPCTETELQNSDFLAGVIAVVFTQSFDKPKKILSELKASAQTLLDHDCRIFVRLAAKRGKMVIDLLDGENLPFTTVALEEDGKPHESRPAGNGEPLLPRIDILDTATSWKDIVRLVLSNSSGHAPNRFLKIILPEAWELSIESELLLRRAFWNCSDVNLAPLEGGKSGIDVYLAHVDLDQDYIDAPWPLPYLVKLGAREEILAEHKNYKSRVEPYIPFHLGPHLISDRCCLGARNGIIVGDYVEESESLRDCARDGRAKSAIACLFTRTLDGWYRAAKPENKSLVDSLSFPEFDPIKAALRLEMAASLGSTKTPNELQVMFGKWSLLMPVRMGPIHWDLHASNVLVRGSDAIVIDFLSNKEGPVLYDAACLEASLLIDGFDKDSDSPTWDVGVWLESIEPLYRDVSLREPPDHPHPKVKSSWFHACVRQIRLHALRMECKSGQYAGALAIALLKKASKDFGASPGEESRRAVAYLLAERILTQPPWLSAMTVGP